ncbi:hypothetical protein [Frigoriglobus tundricola]|uniref:Uncharacterized protein n=1 Tax=Frigoriglobus tundricola TaxID=2774151 RepID=A0A6M5YL92_9BACT|nr:hypothetical protein [Frigoriglobus tundricola]QJW94787.1 hypothetical protein FTUN_2310 [Frigoriglobus tundricola]
MTTFAKIGANKCNSQLSTGPRTIAGTAGVAQNAIKHGIFAAVPVPPGESADDREAHRAGVVVALTPVGLLEVNRAERAALVLWRLQRMARYEAETVAAAIEDVDVPPLPPPKDLDPPLFPAPRQKTRADQPRDTREELRTAGREMAKVGPARDAFRTVMEGPADTVVPFAVAESTLWPRVRGPRRPRTCPPTHRRSIARRTCGRSA